MIFLLFHLEIEGKVGGLLEGGGGGGGGQRVCWPPSQSMGACTPPPPYAYEVVNLKVPISDKFRISTDRSDFVIRRVTRQILITFLRDS